MDELAIVNQAPVIWETMKAVLNSEDVTAIAALMGIGGVSIRDFGNIKNLKKIFTRCNEEFPEGFQSEEQESIFYDTFIELSEFIKKEDKNIDGKVFEKISNILINGIKKEDILTKEYIKILEKLSWLELNVLLELKEVVIYKNYLKSLNFNNKYTEKDCTFQGILDILKKNTSYPQELIFKAIRSLEENNLIRSNVVEFKRMGDEVYKITTELGDEIKKIIKESEKIAK